MLVIRRQQEKCHFKWICDRLNMEMKLIFPCPVMNKNSTTDYVECGHLGILLQRFMMVFDGFCGSIGGNISSHAAAGQEKTST